MNGRFVVGTVGGNVCAHRNGWFRIVNFWLFKKRVFVCSDCLQIIDGKMKKKVNKKKGGE